MKLHSSGCAYAHAHAYAYTDGTHLQHRLIEYYRQMVSLDRVTIARSDWLTMLFFVYISVGHSMRNHSWNKSIRNKWNKNRKEWPNKECIGFNAMNMVHRIRSSASAYYMLCYAVLCCVVSQMHL